MARDKKASRQTGRQRDRHVDRERDTWQETGRHRDRQVEKREAHGKRQEDRETDT